jgi:hypothetical protein
VDQEGRVGGQDEELESDGIWLNRKGVIASQRVRAKRGPMTGSAKPSRTAKTDWIASSLMLLAMTKSIEPEFIMLGSFRVRHQKLSRAH